MLEVRRTEVFAKWLDELRDVRARARVQVRIERPAAGNPSDIRPVGESVSELRIDYGPGYRVYFRRQDRTVVVLLTGGDKRTQSDDIENGPAAGQQPAGEMMTKTATAPYDVAEHLRTREEMAAYLEASIEESRGDTAFVDKALSDIARARGMAQVASDAGLSRESLYKALSGERVLTFETVLRVVEALGLKLRAEAAPGPDRGGSGVAAHRSESCVLTGGRTARRCHMRLSENVRRGKLQPWDRHDHGTTKPCLDRVYSHFHERDCNFGSSKSGEITVRNPDAHYTVYISKRSDGRWRVGYLPNGTCNFNTWDEMIKALHCRGF